MPIHRRGRPTFHTLVFGFNLVGLARVVLAKSGDQPPSILIAVYVAIIPLACLLGMLAADRMQARTPRICTSGISLGVLSLNLIPDASMAMEVAMSDLIAVLTALTVVSGTAVAEVLHRLVGHSPSGSALVPAADPGGKAAAELPSKTRPRPHANPTQHAPENRPRLPDPDLPKS